MGEGGGGDGERLVEEVEAGGAEGGGMEAEDAGCAQVAVHAAHPEPVEEAPLLRAAVAAFALQGEAGGGWRVHGN